MERAPKSLIALILLITHGALGAEVFRCREAGVLKFSDRACAANAEPVKLAPIGRMPAQEASDLERAYNDRRSRLIRNREAEDSRWLQSHREQRARAALIRKAQFEKRVIQGMTEQEVRGAIGSPDEIQRSGATQTWIYHREQGRQVLRFDSDRLSRFGTAGADRKNRY